MWNFKNHVFQPSDCDLWPWPLNSSEILSRSTPLPNFGSVHQSVHPWECWLTDGHAHTHADGTDFIPSTADAGGKKVVVNIRCTHEVCMQTYSRPAKTHAFRLLHMSNHQALGYWKKQTRWNLIRPVSTGLIPTSSFYYLNWLNILKQVFCNYWILWILLGITHVIGSDMLV